VAEPASLDARLRAIWTEAARHGATMPSEPTLAETLATSRPAVREALVRLEERGYIHRRKGADTTVNPALLDIPARLDRRIDTADLIAAMGRTPSVQVLEATATTVTRDEAENHAITPGTTVFRVTKVWSADGVPVLLARDSVPVSRGADAGSVDPALPMVDVAVALNGGRSEWEVVWPGAAALDAVDAAAVGRAPGLPVLALDVTGVDRRGGVCYWTNELHLPGAFRYAMVRRATWR
jgi:GntR family transcriptional regulator